MASRITTSLVALTIISAACLSGCSAGGDTYASIDKITSTSLERTISTTIVEDDFEERVEQADDDALENSVSSSAGGAESSADSAESSVVEDENTEEQIKPREPATREQLAELIAVAELEENDSVVTTRQAFAADGSDTLLLGDSIMVLTEHHVKSLLPGVTVNASSGRSLEHGGANEGYDQNLGVLDWLRAGVGDDYRRVIIGTGNNDFAGISYDQMEEMLRMLEASQVEEVYFITELVTNNDHGTTNTNVEIERVVADGRAHAIRWREAVIESDYSYISDNCHPNNAGCEVYAQLVYDALND